jgi:hypothetical protein
MLMFMTRTVPLRPFAGRRSAAGNDCVEPLSSWARRDVRGQARPAADGAALDRIAEDGESRRGSLRACYDLKCSWRRIDRRGGAALPGRLKP